MFVLGSSISVQVGKKTIGITNKWGVKLNIEGIAKKNQKLTKGGWGDVYLVLKSTHLYIFQ